MLAITYEIPYIFSFLISKLVHFVCIYVVLAVLLDMYPVPAEARRSTGFLRTGGTEDRALPCGSW